MRVQRRRTDREILRDCWSRWTAIIGLFAWRRPARRRVNPRDFAALRTELIAVCRSLAEADSQTGSYYGGLEEMVRPWLNLQVLDRTDQEILLMLLVQCREVERELNGRRWRLELPLHLRPAVRLASTGIVVVGLVLVLQVIGFSVIGTLRDVCNTIWLTVKYADNLQKLSAIAVLIILAAMYTVSRSARAWH
jgi:hypothetical protein